MVLIGLNAYLTRYASNWINFQLKWSIRDPNRSILGNWTMGYWVGDHSPRAQGAVRNCALKKKNKASQTSVYVGIAGTAANGHFFGIGVYTPNFYFQE